MSWWYSDLPRTLRAPHIVQTFNARALPRRTLSQFFSSKRCVLCETTDAAADDIICSDCRTDTQASVVRVMIAKLNFNLYSITQLAIAMRLNGLEERVAVMSGICGRCSGAFGAAVVCTSHHCPLYFERIRIAERLEADQALRDIVLEW